MAAQAGYKGPKRKFDEAVANTRRMFEAIAGIEHVGRINAERNKAR